MKKPEYQPMPIDQIFERSASYRIKFQTALIRIILRDVYGAVKVYEHLTRAAKLPLDKTPDNFPLAQSLIGSLPAETPAMYPPGEYRLPPYEMVIGGISGLLSLKAEDVMKVFNERGNDITLAQAAQIKLLIGLSLDEKNYTAFLDAVKTSVKINGGSDFIISEAMIKEADAVAMTEQASESSAFL